jgi:hypothetical protein
MEEINDAARKCPHCLSIIKETAYDKAVKYFGAIVLVVFALSVLSLFLTHVYREWAKLVDIPLYVEKPWVSDFNISVSDVSSRILESYPTVRDGTEASKRFMSVNFVVANSGGSTVECLEVVVTFKDKNSNILHAFSSVLQETVLPGNKKRNLSAKLKDVVGTDDVHSIEVEILRVKFG